MKLLDKLERRLSWLGIPNLVLVLIVGQIAAWGLSLSDPKIINVMVFSLPHILAGEVWRIVSFLLIPPRVGLIFLIFAWYIFYLMGSALETQWGETKFTLYVLVGILSTVAASFLSILFFGVNMPTDNTFLSLSVLLAFAFLFPNFELNLFLVLPVKVKWLGWLSGAGIAWSFITGSAPVKLYALASVFNFFLFFGSDIIEIFKSRERRKKHQAKMAKIDAELKSEPFHVCTVCGATDVSHPDRDFRYRKDGAICSVCLEKENGTE